MRERGPFGITLWHVVAVTVAISLTAIVITVVVNRDPGDADTQNAGQQPVRNEWAEADVLLPSDDFSGPLQTQWIPFRAREAMWDQRRVDEHWIDPAPVGRELLEQQIGQRMEGIFEEVP